MTMHNNGTTKIDIEKELQSQRHGGPYDRGSADSYYQRQFSPHYFVKDTANSNRIELSASNPEHHELISEYTRGFNHNEAEGSFKEW